jgi:hypothetical protein
VKTDVERKVFELMARDSRRHLEYGRRHLLWYTQHHARGHQNVRFWLTKAEGSLSNELRHSGAEREALVILLANGMEKLQTGVDRLRTIRQRQLADYISLLDGLGLDQLPSLNGGLLAITEDPLAV